MKSLLIAVLLGVAPLAVASDVSTKDRTVMIDNSDSEMNAAIAKAQATLDDFLKIYDAQPKDARGYKLKVKVVDGSESEHLWVTPFKRAGKEFTGTIANQPDLVSNVEAGQNYRFSRKDISDWGYEKDGKQFGSYTVCVMFKHMPKEQVEAYKKRYGFQCD
ncbi:YegJ family protein [Parachitinimonas caeni]|uniref:DUF2314 domain-containing protein n=1 Tax=Parachitinimonas caeni TaxID=3031301 RepID=A0ABT7E106_9NEIS|nr:DUF2314 domain-containing protein [Parachitinimonas caeni]MDK2125724.1 DUF2314 domain-containing protein [Parachitinimonas caeni]